MMFPGRPPWWVRSWRTAGPGAVVLRAVVLGAVPGCAISGRYRDTGESRSTAPLSTSCMTAVAVNSFVTDARGKSVSGVTGILRDRSANP